MQRAEIIGLSDQAWAAFDVRRDYLPDAMERLISWVYKACNGKGNLRHWDQDDAHDILQSHIFITVGDALQRSHGRKHQDIKGEERWNFLEGTSGVIITTKLPRLLASEAPINLTENPDPDVLCGVSRHGHGSRQYASLGEAVVDERFMLGSHALSPELAMLDEEEQEAEFQTRSDLVEHIRPLLTPDQYVVMRMHIVEAMPASFLAKRQERTAHTVRCVIRRACNTILTAVAEGKLPVKSIDLTPLFSTDPRLHERLKHFLQLHPEHENKFRPRKAQRPAASPARTKPAKSSFSARRRQVKMSRGQALACSDVALAD